MGGEKLMDKIENTAQRFIRLSNALNNVDKNKAEAIELIQEHFNDVINDVICDLSEFMNDTAELMRQYVTDVSALNAEINALRAQMRWHNLSEKRPETERIVEVRSEETDGRIQYNVAYMDENGEFWDGIGDSLRFKAAYWRYPELTDSKVNTKEVPTTLSFYMDKFKKQEQKIEELQKVITDTQVWHKYPEEIPVDPINGELISTLCAVRTDSGEYKIARYEDNKFIEEVVFGEEIKNVELWYCLSQLYEPDDDDV